MPNRKLFQTSVQSKVKVTDTTNNAGGKAYSLSSESSLAQHVVTGCFNSTFYASAEDQLDKITGFAAECHSEFIGKVAVYGHEVAGMKDTPSYLLAVLASRMSEDEEARRIFNLVFPRVVTNGKMLMNFVQMIRSGKAGRKSFGTTAKRAIHKWFESRTGNAIFTSSIGGNPSMGDIIKMVHPKPDTEDKKALYAYFIGRPYELEKLPPKVAHLELFKKAKAEGRTGFEVPDVPFQMLTALKLTKEEWVSIAKQLPWNALRMNLNTLQRHGVFDVPGMTKQIADTLSNPELVRKFNVFPYQLLAAYMNTDDVPSEVRNALQDAMEVATENVPTFGVDVAMCLDTSGSMTMNSVTGTRAGSTSKVKCIDVAALAGASVARVNKNTLLLPFDTRVHPANSINPRDSVMTNATKLSKFGGGGTNCGAALRVLNGQVGPRPKLVIYVSDNESWFNSPNRYGMTDTEMAHEWAEYKRKTPDAKLVCIDIVPNATTQVSDQKDVLNVGGFSDKVWTAVDSFVKNGSVTFVDVINNFEL